MLLKNVCVPDLDQNSLILCISSAFVHNDGIVCHLNLIQSKRWRLGTCGHQAHVYAFTSLNPSIIGGFRAPRLPRAGDIRGGAAMS